MASNTTTVTTNTWQIIYPVYLNAKSTLAEGRRIPKEKAVDNPTLDDIVKVCEHLGFKTIVEVCSNYHTSTVTEILMSNCLTRSFSWTSLKKLIRETFYKEEEYEFLLKKTTSQSTITSSPVCNTRNCVSIRSTNRESS
jgi:signal recognition particle subunit SEC65